MGQNNLISFPFSFSFLLFFSSSRTHARSSEFVPELPFFSPGFALNSLSRWISPDLAFSRRISLALAENPRISLNLAGNLKISPGT
jgi:hypothetical protein